MTLNLYFLFEFYCFREPDACPTIHQANYPLFDEAKVLQFYAIILRTKKRIVFLKLNTVNRPLNTSKNGSK